MTLIHFASKIVNAIIPGAAAVPPHQPAADDNALLDLIDEQIAQREDIFAFRVLERAYDRTLAHIDGVTNRLGVIIAVQTGIEAVLIDKIDEFTRGPGILGFIVIAATAILFRAGGEADFIDAATFIDAFAQHPRQTREALRTRLANVIARNERLAAARQRLFSAALAMTVAALGWAFTANLLHWTKP